MLALDDIPSPNPEIVARVLEDEAVLVLPTQGQVKVLNAVGARIWTLLDGVHTTGEIINVICEEYETSLEMATRDVINFLEQLSERDIVTFA